MAGGQTGTGHPAPSPATFQTGAMDEVIPSGSLLATATAARAGPEQGTLQSLPSEVPRRECFLVEVFLELPMPTDRFCPCPNYARLAKFEARFPDRETEAERTQRQSGGLLSFNWGAGARRHLSKSVVAHKLIPTLGKLRQEGHNFDVSLDYFGRPCQQTNKNPSFLLPLCSLMARGASSYPKGSEI